MKKALLLADPKSNAWSFAEQIKDYIQQEKHISLPLDAIESGLFPNDELNLCVPVGSKKKDVFVVQDPTQYPQNWGWGTMMINNSLILAEAESISYVFPDMHFNRQERKTRSGVPITAGILPTYLKQYWPIVKRAITMDLHAPGVVGLWDPIAIKDLLSAPTLARYLKENNFLGSDFVVTAADKGDVERVDKLCSFLNLENPPAYIYKQRNPQTQKIEKMVLVGDVENKRTLIPDDIIDTGGTACKAGNLLLNEGAKEVYLFGAHGWFTKGTKFITDVFKKTIISNTYLSKEMDLEGISVMNVVPVFAEAVYRSQKGESISDLFKLKNNH